MLVNRLQYILYNIPYTHIFIVTKVKLVTCIKYKSMLTPYEEG